MTLQRGARRRNAGPPSRIRIRTREVRAARRISTARPRESSPSRVSQIRTRRATLSSRGHGPGFQPFADGGDEPTSGGGGGGATGGGGGGGAPPPGSCPCAATRRTPHIEARCGMDSRHRGKTPGMGERDESQEAEEPAGEAGEKPEPPAKVTLEDVSRLSPEHAPDDRDE